MARPKSNKPTKEEVICSNCGILYPRNIQSKTIIGKRNNSCSPQCSRALNKSFGTIIIDKLHQFFGKSDPSACIVVSAWGNEDDDGQNQEVYIEHYRGHALKSYADLRDENNVVHKLKEK